MQEFFSEVSYAVTMAAKKSQLRRLRENAGMSLRELARIIDEQPTNLSYWERTGKLPRADLLAPMADALGVSIEELLGLPKPKGNGKPGGRLGDVVDRISQMPRRQRERVVGIVETVLAGEEAQK